MSSGTLLYYFWARVRVRYTHIDLVLFKTKISEQVKYHFIQNIYIYIYIYIYIIFFYLLKNKIKAFQMINTFTVIL